MIHHISIAVNHPLHVGQVLAEIFQGQCFLFPPCPESYIVLVDDGAGSAIELYPADIQLIPESAAVGFSTENMTQTFTSVHAAVSVPLSQTQIEAIGNREGWLVRLCDRGFFQVVELWVENRFMLELLTPEMAQAYSGFAKPSNYEAFLSQFALAEA